MQMLGDGPGNAHAVVRARASPNFVEQHKAARSQVVQDGRRLIHFDHEGGLAAADVVGGTNTCEDAVEDAEVGRLGGDKRPGLRHQ